MLATSPRKRGEVKNGRRASNGLLRGACHRARISRDPLARNDGLISSSWLFEIKSEIQRRRPGQASESKRDPGPTRERNALIATPRLLVGVRTINIFQVTNAGGYGFLLPCAIAH